VSGDIRRPPTWRERESLAILDAETDDLEVLLEIEFEDTKGFSHVCHRGCDGHEGHDDVALLDVVFYPFPVYRDVAFNVVEAFMAETLAKLVVANVQPVDLPVRFVQHVFREGVADESVHSEHQESQG
jgi:hypothetical protein